MGFHIEINSILRSDAYGELVKGHEYAFEKSGSRLFFDDIPIWLTQSDWTALAEIKVETQTRIADKVTGKFRVVHVYVDAEQEMVTRVFRRMYAGGPDPFIYVLMTDADYIKSARAGEFAPRSLQKEGFVHASPADQVTRVANKHYKGKGTLRLLFVAKDRIEPELRWEKPKPPSTTPGLYPHVYGPLNMWAVERVIPIKPDNNGEFNIDPVKLADAGLMDSAEDYPSK